MERRLAAIMAADVVGYSRLMEAGEAPADSDEYLKVEGKYEKYFSANPGSSVKG